ncbi:MAG: diguanylate cyclase [Chloroflexi bacterium]|nr:diguanylate cyclase [Chloroflexota bacterium]
MSQQEVGSEMPADREKKHILIADDSRLVLRMTGAILEGAGYKTSTVLDGFQAIQAAYEQAPDLIILDIMMPQINGYQVCRLLKSDPATTDIPVIMLTSKSQRTDRYWGLSTGADGYLTKGGDTDELLALVQELLAKHHKVRPTQPEGAVSQSSTPFSILERVNNLLDRRLYEVTVMNEITQLASPMVSYHDTVRAAVKKIAQMFEIDAVALVHTIEQDTALHIVPIRPVSPTYIARLEEKALQEASLPFDGQGQQIRRYVAPSQHDDSPAPMRNQLETVYHIPILRGGAAKGVFVIAGDHRLLIGPEDERTAQQLVSQAAVVMENAWLYDKIRQMAITDGLTGIYNRSHFLHLLDQEMLRSSRYGRPFGLMMLDIDHFKRVNDTFGHQVGDQVLQAIVSQCIEELREPDEIGRYGGEEFMVLLPETESAQASLVAERVRTRIADTVVHTTAGDARVTVSIGVTAWPDCGTDDSEAIIAKVDSALYQAKTNGRNRVVTEY